MELVGKLITLRTPTDADWEGWLFPMNDLETMRALLPYFKREVWTAEDLKQRYVGRGIPFSVVRNSDQKIVGQMGIKNLIEGQEGELGTIIHRETWGTGIANECKLLLFRHAFETMKLKKVYLVTDHQNERTKRHLEKIGLAITESTERGLRYDLEKANWPKVEQTLERLLKNR